MNEQDIDLNLFVSILNDAVEKVKTEENPVVLNDLRRLYKKTVPFSLRTYVAAYLSKSLVLGNTSSNKRNHSIAKSREWKNNRDTQHLNSINKDSSRKAQKVQLDESLATTIFISIGRNRRVYPRDLVGLLASVGGVERDRIGDIRVLANYSFVQLLIEDAEKVISLLNGFEYRGRKLSVSYSKQKIAVDKALSDSNEVSGLDNTADLSDEDAAAYVAAEKAASNVDPFTDPMKK